MTREEAKKERADFNDAIAAELESHFSNGSHFIYVDGDPTDEVVKLREQILKGVVRLLRLRGRR